VPTPVVALKTCDEFIESRSVSIAVDGGKSLSGVFEGLAKSPSSGKPASNEKRSAGLL